MTARLHEQELVRRLLAGEVAAFDQFADEYTPPLYRFAQRRLRGDREVTKDVVQSTLCKVIAKLDTFRGEASLMTWLCACCRNEIAAHFRRQLRVAGEVEFHAAEESGATPLEEHNQPSKALTAGPEANAMQRESADLVHTALDTLPPHYGRALEWKYLEDQSVKEIAKRLGVGPKAAESLLTRARGAFREAYDRIGTETGQKRRPQRTLGPVGVEQG